jgi:hypothetical protein
MFRSIGAGWLGALADERLILHPWAHPVLTLSEEK